MNEEQLYRESYDAGETLSEAFERDARRYHKAFTEEEEVRLI